MEERFTFTKDAVTGQLIVLDRLTSVLCSFEEGRFQSSAMWQLHRGIEEIQDHPITAMRVYRAMTSIARYLKQNYPDVIGEEYPPIEYVRAEQRYIDCSEADGNRLIDNNKAAIGNYPNEDDTKSLESHSRQLFGTKNNIDMARLNQEHYDILLKQLKDMHNAIMAFHDSTTDKNKTDEEKIKDSREYMSQIMWAKAHLQSNLQSIQYGEEETGFRIEYLPCPNKE